MRSRTWRGMAAIVTCMIGAASSVSARAEPPPLHETTLGDLTFHYSTARWRIERHGDALTATCLHMDCRDVVFDFTVRDGDGACTKESVRETAAQLFPLADRHPVNIIPVGRFGVVKAESWLGPNFGAPRYVFACLEWQDREYRFAVRPETVGATTWSGGALHDLMSHVTAPPARMAAIRLRGMTLNYPTDRWRAEAAIAGQSLRLHCLLPTCHDHGEAVTVFAEASDVGCSFDPDQTHWPNAGTDVIPLPPANPDAPAFLLALTHSPCRNYVPDRRVACAWHEGITYRIVSSGGIGCKSSMGVPAEAFDDLVAGVRLVPGAK